MTLRHFFRRRREYDDLSAEIRAHIDEKTDALVAAGMSNRDAAREARRAFGRVGRIEEEGRDVWAAPAVDALAADVRLALRVVRRHPGYATGVMLVAALGVAACATTFAVVGGVLLAPLGFPGADRVFEVEMRTTGGDYTAAVPVAVYERIAAGSPVVEAIGAGYPREAVVDWSGHPERVRGERVTSSYLRVYGVTPALGRAFADDEGERQDAVVMLGDLAWRRVFAGDSGIVGRTVTLDGAPHVVVGVMPAGFRSFFDEEPTFWRPMSVARSRGPYGVNAQLRLRAGVDSARAAAWLASGPPTRIPSIRGRAGDSVSAVPVLVPIADRVRGDVDRPLWVLFAAVLVVLALAATNVATMQLARAAVRTGELGVRRAIGATVTRQAQHLMIESLVLCGIGGAAGVLVAVWATGAIASLGYRVLPRMDLVALDARTILFAVAATVMIGLVGGVGPALLAPRALTPGGAGRATGARTSAALVVSQVALSVILTVGAGLLLKGFLRVLPSAPGYETRNRASLLVTLDPARMPKPLDDASALRFTHNVAQRMRGTRGITDVATMWFAPMSGSAVRVELRVPGQPVPDRPLYAFANGISSNWTDVMRVPVREGRAFTAADSRGAPLVAVVSAAAAQRLWPGQAPVTGRQVEAIEGAERRLVTVVGVVGDTRFLGTDSRIRPQVYFPMEQAPPQIVTFIAATSEPPGAVARALQDAVWAEAPQLAIGAATDLEATAMNSVRRPRFFAWAIGGFAASAVTLTGLAIYGLLAFGVAQGRREIGIRLAIGATPGLVGRTVLLRAAALGGAGACIGAAVAFGVSRFLESLLTEVSATDASVFTAATLGVLAVAVVAALAPAARALRIDPAECLRSE